MMPATSSNCPVKSPEMSPELSPELSLEQGLKNNPQSSPETSTLSVAGGQNRLLSGSDAGVLTRAGAELRPFWRRIPSWRSVLAFGSGLGLCAVPSTLGAQTALANNTSDVAVASSVADVRPPAATPSVPGMIVVPLSEIPGQVEALPKDAVLRARALAALKIPNAVVEMVMVEPDEIPANQESGQASGMSAAPGTSGTSAGVGEGNAPPGNASGPDGGRAPDLVFARANAPLDRAAFELPVWQDPMMLRIDAPFPGAVGVLQQVAGTLELGSAQRISVQELPGHELKARSRERMSRTQTRLLLETRQQTLQLLGVIPSSLQLRTDLLELFPSKGVGLYEPEGNTIYLHESLSPEAAKAVLARELVHALQAQNFPLEQRLEKVDDEEMRTARAIVQGQGLLVSRQVAGVTPGALFRNAVGGEQGGKSPNAQGDRVCSDALAMVRADAPLYAPGSMNGIESPLTVLGARFLEQFQLQYGNSVGALAALPVSTEQLLHFDRYVAQEKPQNLQVLNLLSIVGGAWRVVEQTRMGEMLTACWLHEPLGGLASTGWGNDMVTVFEREGDGPVSAGTQGGAHSRGGTRQMVAWRTVWDREQDAVEFSGAARARLRERFAEVGFVKQIPFGLILATEQEAHGMLRLGSEVRVVIGADVDAVEALLEAEW